MLIGYYQISPINEQVADYVAVPYPGGYVNPYLQVGIQEDDIEEVLFSGYKNDLFSELSMKLSEITHEQLLQEYEKRKQEK